MNFLTVRDFLNKSATDWVTVAGKLDYKIIFVGKKNWQGSVGGSQGRPEKERRGHAPLMEYRPSLSSATHDKAGEF